jgi:Flp pilus assembly protein TadD
MLVDEKNYSEALGAARKATEFPNPGPPAWRVRATVEFARGMFKQAADSAAKAVELDSHDPDPLLILSAAEQKLFRYAEAKSVLEKGMRLFPGQARFSVQYGKLLLDPGGAWSAADQKSAVALLESVLARDDSLFEAHLALGRYWVSKGSTAQALPHLVAAARLSPREAQVHFLLASAYRLLGRASDAAEEIGQYQALQGAGAEPASGGQGTKPVPKVGPDDEKQ